MVCQESDVEFFADYSDTDSNSDDREYTQAVSILINTIERIHFFVQRSTLLCHVYVFSLNLLFVLRKTHSLNLMKIQICDNNSCAWSML